MGVSMNMNEHDPFLAENESVVGEERRKPTQGV
jgi:hypothetical protein